jgi:two-component system sensor histidine kinase KdpD
LRCDVRRARFRGVSNEPHSVSWRALVRPAAATAAMVGVAALLANWSEYWLDPQSLSLFFVVPIVIAAMRYGLGPALGASVLSVAAINFLFVQPRYTLAVARPQDLAALLLLAAVGVLVSLVAARARMAEAARAEAARECFTRSAHAAGDDHVHAAEFATVCC